MKKNYFLLLLALGLFAIKGVAQIQPCSSDEATHLLYAQHPDVQKFVENYTKQIQDGLKNIDLKVAHKTTDSANSDTFWYDIPIVIHVVHDYGPENISDDYIFNALKDWNIVYAGANPDTSTVLTAYKKWIGIPRIRLHLATIDPLGMATKGITRHRSYLTYIGGDQSKLDDWPRASYVNIWVINTMNTANGNAAAYAYRPDGASLVPFWDGVITLYDYFANAYSGPIAVSKTINHEMGHVFDLIHPFGSLNSAPAPDCGDDEVDDTPPTRGHYANGCQTTGTHPALYDTTCATNYFKVYPASNGYDSLVDYPDTVNAQNIMDYTYCSRMFTIGQVVRMHNALNNSLSDRNNLWTSFNLTHTGALNPMPDLKPIPEFSAMNTSASAPALKYFTCPFDTINGRILFYNESWNDTISTVRWQFTNGATTPDVTLRGSSYLINNFTQPGWVSLTMTATDTTGTTTGGRTPNSTTTTFPNAIFVTDAVGTDPTSYYQEFNPTGDVTKWPIFNYYNNEFKWQLDSTTGYYDHYCMKYVGFDTRLNPPFGIYPYNGTPSGDFDDLFSIPFDLSSFNSSMPCNLNFYYAGASRTSNGLGVNDSLEIQYSIDSSKTWNNMFVMQKSSLNNNGAYIIPFAPLSMQDWSPMTINIPNSIRTKYTLFRFRYFPGVGTDGFSSGNNFYLDRLNISSSPASVSNVKTDNTEVVIAPNPTHGNAYVIVSGNNITLANIVVTDITGKVVYTTSQQISGIQTKIEIPQSAIGVKGIYLVQTITGKNVNTQKLVVY